MVGYLIINNLVDVLGGYCFGFLMNLFDIYYRSIYMKGYIDIVGILIIILI